MADDSNDSDARDVRDAAILKFDVAIDAYDTRESTANGDFGRYVLAIVAAGQHVLHVLAGNRDDARLFHIHHVDGGSGTIHDEDERTLVHHLVYELALVTLNGDRDDTALRTACAALVGRIGHTAHEPANSPSGALQRPSGALQRPGARYDVSGS